ncbi:MerR family transcriptional regulator [Rouxiella sp. Mn2063]|uniref:MerR family transcriptional regulator n=1 Tax=Rouxiella sp. Mn2063 TaxID=3395262 RepID=UPI003BD2AF6D
MSLYSIGEVARICGINPVTLRAWQRRYGLLKPQRTEGGHRQFDDTDLDTIQTILAWINRGVPVGQIKALLEGTLSPLPSGWSQSEQRLLSALQEFQTSKARQIINELGRDYPANALVNNVLRPLRTRLKSHPSTLLMCSQLDGMLIEHAITCLNAARKTPGINVLLLGWGDIDSTELWLEAIVRSQDGVHIELLAQPLAEPQLEGIQAAQILVWAEGRLTKLQRIRLQEWQQIGLPVQLLGSAALLATAPIAELTLIKGLHQNKDEI